MRVIAEGKKAIVKLWGSSSPKEDTSYRLMRYLIREDCEDGTLLLNTVNGELVLLNREEVEILDALPMPYKSGMEELIARHFLVTEGFDDVKSVDQIRTVLKKLQTTSAITGYTIIPTSYCNARCFYCYESNDPHYSMTPETAEKVVDYIIAHCGSRKKVSLHWFGGEPTLGEKRIDQICDRLTEEGIEFHSSMISNGYLFSQEMAQKAREKWHLHTIQITLDGTEAVYNRTKAYVNVQDSPFRRVMDNIAFLLDEKVRVSVRMNLGFHNTDDLKELIQELAERFSGRKNFTAYVHELFEDQGFSPVCHSLAERFQLEEIKSVLNGLIKEKGCICTDSLRNDGSLPAMKVFYCMSDTAASLQINPLGQFGKCEHFLFGKLIGDLDQGLDFNSPLVEYWLHPSYAEICKGCSLYPYCGVIDTCENKDYCFSDQILENRITSVKMIMRKKLEEESQYESA